MAERFLNTNEFTLDELKGKADNANTIKKYEYKKNTICDYRHVMFRVVCVEEGLADVILSCI